MTATALSAIAIVESAGAELRPTSEPEKYSLRCLLHEDRQPSAMVRDRVYHCAVCGTFRPRELAERLAIDPDTCRRTMAPASARTRPRTRRPSPQVIDGVRYLWDRALERGRDDDVCDRDAGAYDWLRRRGLALAWELGMVGITWPRWSLAESTGWWPRAGYRVVCALYDDRGEVLSLQARRVTQREPRTRSYPGAPVRGLAFVSPAGLRLLRGADASDTVILAEGLTDCLALAIVAGNVPVLSSPGQGLAAAAVGEWARGRRIVIALDQDEAGEKGAVAAAEAVERHGGDPLRLRWSEAAGDACDELQAIGAEAMERQLAEVLDGGETS